MIGTARLDGAARGNVSDLRNILEQLINQTNLVANAIGVDVVPAQQAKRPDRIPVPPLAAMEVTGDDGYFIVAITNPFNINGEVYHQVQSSSTLPFSTSQDIITYGPAPATSRVVNAPSQTLYWRWRTKYFNSNYNAWSYFPTAVYSGTIRSISLSTLNTRQIIGETPLVQVGTSLVVTIYPFTARLGEVEVEYTGGTVTVDSYDNWIIYFRDPDKIGGDVTYLATLDPLEANDSDGNVIIGTIAVSSFGGGLGVNYTRPFQSSCVIEDSVITLHDLTTVLAQDVAVGDILLGVDGGEETVVRVEVIENRPCFSIETKFGFILQGACSHHLLYGGGGGSLVLSDINLGDQILVRSGTENFADFVVTKTLLSIQTVYRIVTNRTKTYLVDGVWARDLGGGLVT